MTGAPSPVDTAQLADLGLEVKAEVGEEGREEEAGADRSPGG
jgi:hypothetical protein